MKEIKAYIHRSRVADVISALKESASWSAAGSGEHNLTAYRVKGSVIPLDEGERRYSVDLGDEVIDEYKLGACRTWAFDKRKSAPARTVFIGFAGP